eukprot:3475489-Amphidinium_carterae.1
MVIGRYSNSRLLTLQVDASHHLHLIASDEEVISVHYPTGILSVSVHAGWITSTHNCSPLPAPNALQEPLQHALISYFPSVK